MSNGVYDITPERPGSEVPGPVADSPAGTEAPLSSVTGLRPIGSPRDMRVKLKESYFSVQWEDNAGGNEDLDS